MARPLAYPGQPLVSVSLSVRPDQWAGLQRLAQEDDRSISAIVRIALDEYLARRQPPVLRPVVEAV
jgi:hypothetical protein